MRQWLQARAAFLLCIQVNAMAARFLVLALLMAIFAGIGLAQPVDPLRDIVAENTRISTQIAAAEAALGHRRAELADLHREKRDLDERMRWVQRRAAVHALGQEFAKTLIQFLHRLPTTERFAATSERNAQLLAEASDAELGVKWALSELENLDAATARRLEALSPPIPPEQAAPTEQAKPPRAEVHAALAKQRDLLKRLAAMQEKHLEGLHQSEEVLRDLQQHVEAARQELTNFLFWIPAVPTIRTFSELAPSLAWTVSPMHWRAAGELIQENLAQRPFWPGVALLLATILLVLRGRLQAALAALSPAVVPGGSYRIGHALAALMITFALALPIPIVLWTAAILLAAAPESQPFALALGLALRAIASLLLALYTIAWLLEHKGVALRHFDWDEAIVGGAARGLRWFTAIFTPLIFVAALNGFEYAPFANQESLARLTFSLAMMTIVAFCLRLFRSGSPFMRQLVALAPRSWTVRFHALWFGGSVVIPLAIAALALAGYFVAAGYLWARLVYSQYFVLIAALLYGLTARWVEIQRFRLAQRREEEGGQRAACAAAPGAEPVKTGRVRLDIAALGERTQSLLDLFVTLLLLAALWWVWRDAVAALSMIGDYTLWNSVETVDGKQVTHALTVQRLFLALLVLAVTAMAVRRVGSFLDIVLLAHFDMPSDATYTITVMTRYVVAIAGILLACDLVGLAWSNVQWLVAALGVGIGFGLQEIVANFVSGLIVLTERPIRIGDVVTVGSISGTVARIHARATVVVDFDSKEVIIPNKAFITEQVVNWTLSNQTTRLLLKIGVAYGSDIALVQRLILDAVRSNHDVLPEPEPSVFLVAFGESSLDFEIRAFVASFDDRLRVQHEINLEVARVLGEHGIDIPYPQRDLHIHSAPGLADSLRDDQRDQDR